ncbi:MAG TPA: sugar phosphate isomerase/epimerase [Fimbriimonadaceae bacterium]|nr:sugar phosphate isomerase/epimerase [Fimbriimonadaceae bacterium]
MSSLVGFRSKAALVAGFLLACFPAAASPEDHAGRARHYLIGLQLYTVRDQMAKDVPGVLKSVAQMGFTGVEFAGYYGYTAEQLRKMLDEDHLACYGSHISLDDLSEANFEKTVAFNQTLGNKLVTVASLPGRSHKDMQGLLETTRQFNELAAKLKKHGIMLAFHNHVTEFQQIDGQLFWDAFFGNTDKDVKIQFDIGNAMAAGQQAAPFLVKFPGRLMSVHVKDHSNTNSNALLGEGDEHWADVIPLLQGRNGPRWFIIEQEDYPYPSLECAKRCLDTFKKMMGIEP